jgi:hypothetical protein
MNEPIKIGDIGMELADNGRSRTRSRSPSAGLVDVDIVGSEPA